jgi:hypothetical protein
MAWGIEGVGNYGAPDVTVRTAAKTDTGKSKCEISNHVPNAKERIISS